jgi:predicted DNA-binding protein
MEKLAGIIFKPDVYERDLREKLLKEVKDFNLSIKEIFEIQLGSKEIRLLYPDLITDRNIFINLENYFQREKNELIIVSTPSVSRDLIKELNIWKGSNLEKTGIRGKYLSENLPRDSHIFMRENLLHTFDTYKSFVKFYNLYK